MAGRITDLFRDKKRMHKKHSKKGTKAVKEWLKKVQIGYSFETATGKVNVVEECDGVNVYFSTEKSVKPNKLSVKDLKLAATYLFYMRAITRKDIGRVAQFNSAAFGILVTIFDGKEATLTKLSNGVFVLTVEGCQFYFSGMERASDSDWNLIKDNDADAVLMNYYNLKDSNSENWIRHVEDSPIKIMMDSGEFQRYQKYLDVMKSYNRGLLTEEERTWWLYKIKLSVYKYADFINAHKRYLHTFVTMDVTESPEETRRNYKILKKLTGMDPIPAWHVNHTNWKESDWDGLEKLVKEGHSVIAIGATVPMKSERRKRPFLEKLFELYPTQNFHLLGYSAYGLVDLPIFSADSGGWINGRKADKKGRFQIYSYGGKFNATEKIEPFLKLGESLKKFKEKCVTYNIKRLSSLSEASFQMNLFDMTVE